MESIQPEIQPEAEQAQPEAEQAQPEAEQAQPEAEQAQPEAEPEIYEEGEQKQQQTCSVQGPKNKCNNIVSQRLIGTNIHSDMSAKTFWLLSTSIQC